MEYQDDFLKRIERLELEILQYKLFLQMMENYNEIQNEVF